MAKLGLIWLNLANFYNCEGDGGCDDDGDWDGSEDVDGDGCKKMWLMKKGYIYLSRYRCYYPHT